MLQTYQGYIREDGRFMSYESVVIPTNIEVHLTITGKKANLNSRSQRQRDALKKLISTISTIENEPLDDEFDKLINTRVNISTRKSLQIKGF